jgi:hypothetical protein
VPQTFFPVSNGGFLPKAATTNPRIISGASAPCRSAVPQEPLTIARHFNAGMQFIKTPSPAGTAEVRCIHLIVAAVCDRRKRRSQSAATVKILKMIHHLKFRSSLRDFDFFHVTPGVETPGYFHSVSPRRGGNFPRRWRLTQIRTQFLFFIFGDIGY